MASNKKITLILNGTKKSYAFDEALMLCQQLAASRSVHLKTAIEQLLLNEQIDQKQRQKIYQIAFNALMKMSLYQPLIRLANQAISEDSHWSVAYYARGIGYRFEREPKKALENLSKAVSLSPNQYSWQRLLGTLYKEFGDNEQATLYFNQCIEHDHLDAESYWLRSDFHLQLSDTDVEYLQQIISANQERSPKTLQATAFAAFTLFRHYDAIDNTKQAFKYLEKGNAALTKLVPFNLAKDLNEHQAIAQLCNDAFCSKSDTSNTLGEHSIFICGMPRSGTTLAEQIITSHSQVNAGDELFYLAKASQAVLAEHQIKASFPSWLKQLTSSQWRQVGEHYLNLCQPLAKGKWLTDKMPLNYKALGIVHKALPQAKIIYCRRDREDTVWGCFKQILGHGNGFSNDLDQLVQMYQAHSKLMSHWQATLNDKLFVLDYQALVTQPEKVIQQMCHFLGLAFEEQMLSFFNNKHAIHTISSTQVRKPLSENHLNSWQRYREFIEHQFK